MGCVYIMPSSGGRCHHIGCDFTGAPDVGTSCDEKVRGIVRTTAATGRPGGAVFGARPGSWDAGGPGLGRCERESGPYWNVVSQARRMALLEPLMAGPVNTVNKSSGRPSEPFAARRVLRACGQPRTLDSVLLAGSRMNGHPPRGERAGHSSQPDAAPHLLLIEDDAALSQVLIQTLATHLPALTVTAVSAVEQAWRTVQEGDVRLLITDLNLPGLRGWSFIQRLRERGWHRPVIVISGAPVEAGPEVCEMLQITAILRKPFEMTSLLDAIAAALNRDTQDSFHERT